MTAALAPGTVLGGDFVVIRPLAEGGMGAVWVAQQRSTGRQRAIKVMHADMARSAELRARFEREARVGSTIDSSHVVEVLAAGVEPLPWIAMELLDGEDLGAHLERRGPLAPAETLAIYRQLCHAVAAAHDRRIVHRDLKPENVFLARSTLVGLPFLVTVLDFGIAKFVLEAGTSGRRNTASIGSRPWMAPEQLLVGAPIGPQTDVWALGLIAFTLLSGRKYWRAMYDQNSNEMMLLMELSSGSLVPASQRARENGSQASLPAAFDEWFARCVARDLAARYADARSAGTALEAVLATGAAQRHSPTIAMAPVRPAATDISSRTAPMTVPPTEALASNDFATLYDDYVRIEGRASRAPMTFQRFKSTLSALARDVMAKHRCTLVEFKVVDQPFQGDFFRDSASRRAVDT
jgi:serine/threonine protein kinase